MESSSPSPLILRWAAILCGLSVPFTFFIALRLPRGFLRLLALSPFLLAFPVLHGLLPSPNGRGALAFTLCWDCPCKLLLLCFDRPANLPTWARCSFPHFLLAVLLPARVLQGVTPTSSSSSSSSHHLPTLLSHISALLFYFNLSPSIPHALSYPTLFLHVYLSIDLPYRVSAVLMHFLLGVELHPAFNEPSLSTSLTQFWGNRWNLAANSLLRQTVYNPVVELLSGGIKRAPEQLHQTNGASADLKLWVRIVAVCVTFSASGLIHELIYFNLTQTKSPSWEVTTFFALQGMAVSAEITLRRISVTHQLLCKVPRHVKIFLTLGFLSATAKWLFLAPLVNSHFFLRCSSEHLGFQNWAARLLLAVYQN